MSLTSINPKLTKAWPKLQAHFNEIKEDHFYDYFKKDNRRADKFSVSWNKFYFDFSKNKINVKTMLLFEELLNEINFKSSIVKYFSGEKINTTESRSVLHTALRADKDENIFIDDCNIFSKISEAKNKIRFFTESILSGSHKGFNGDNIDTVVNIGIGGSDLGPSMVIESLRHYKNHINTHFISNVDGDHVNEVLKKLNPETTLFVIVSKTFTTQETLSNATTIKEWFLQHAKQEDIENQFVAVSTNIEKVEDFGIDAQNIFPMWDWVGGRFSLWSAVGLSISLAVGYKNFEALLGGAHKMDIHFKEEKFEQNIPVLLAFLSIWYNNFFKAESEAIIPYTQYLNQFATYLQQAIMESNGKSVDREGNKVNYQTGNLIWGEPGTNSQHAFFQLIHQGTKLIPADFIGFGTSLHGNQDHQDKLMSNFFAQTEALLNGKTKAEVIAEGTNESIIPYKIFDGNRPTNTIFIEKLTPESLGKLIAMYEHKIFVQGIVWNVFSYDQFGVELGKQLAGKILNEFTENSDTKHDASTSNLISLYKSMR